MIFFFWDTVKTTMVDKNISLKSLSEKTGLNYRTLQNQIGREIEPSVSDAYKIAQALGVSVEFLLTRESSSSAEKELLKIKSVLKDLIN